MSGTTPRDDLVPKTRDYTVPKTFALAGMSNMVSGTITNPIDVVKVRMQCDNQNKGIYQRSYPGLLRGAAKIARTEGPRVLLTAGLLPSLFREASYSTIRMGGYEPVKKLISPGNEALPLYKKILAGATSGSIGALCTTPFDLVKVRLQTDVQRKLPNMFVLLYRTGRDEGIFRGLWRGVGPNIGRGTLTTAAQIPSYDHSKHFLLELGWFKEGPVLHFLCSIFAGLCVATANNPVDVVKSRMQSEFRKPGVQAKYRNIPQVMLLIVRTEGLQGLYKGWFPNWARVGPHTCMTFLLFEQLRRISGIKPI